MKIIRKYLIIGLLLSFVTELTGQIKTPWEGTARTNEGEKMQTVKPAGLPESVSFAGEEVPLQYFDVRESLQRELTSLMYMHGSMTYTVQLSGRYRAQIEQILKEEGLHPDFFYLCVAESTLQPLVSVAGAKGYWQFMASAAKEFGLLVNNEVDERYNLEKSTRAACKYLKSAYAKFGNWTLAAASYNIGMANIQERIKYQSLNNYYDMQLPIETARYIYKAIAFKIIMNNLEDYGFYISEKDMFKPIKCKEVFVTGSVENWSDFAAKNNTNFKLLKICNEWIRSNKLINKEKRNFKVAVPIFESREAL